MGTRNNLDHISTRERSVEWSYPSIDTHSDRMISHIRMYRISKIYRGRPVWEFKNISFWRKYKHSRERDLLSEERSLLEERIHGHLDEILISLCFLHSITVDFVEYVSSSPLVSICVHFSRADLYFYRLSVSIET